MLRRFACAAAVAAPLVLGAWMPSTGLASTGATVAPSSPLASMAGRCHGASQAPGDASPQKARTAMLCLVNRFRRAHGRRALRINRQLTRAAQAYSARMAGDRFFSHTAPNGGTMVDRLRQVGYASPSTSWTVGENLGWGTDTSAAPVVIVDAWLRSPGHRANLLSRRYREAGVGVAQPTPQGRTGATYALEFGARG